MISIEKSENAEFFKIRTIQPLILALVCSLKETKEGYIDIDTIEVSKGEYKGKENDEELLQQSMEYWNDERKELINNILDTGVKESSISIPVNQAEEFIQILNDRRMRISEQYEIGEVELHAAPPEVNGQTEEEILEAVIKYRAANEINLLGHIQALIIEEVLS